LGRQTLGKGEGKKGGREMGVLERARSAVEALREKRAAEAIRLQAAQEVLERLIELARRAGALLKVSCPEEKECLIVDSSGGVIFRRGDETIRAYSPDDRTNLVPRLVDFLLSEEVDVKAEEGG
jgi:hypothetical protein